jgi:UDP-N-acetylglucosamine 2-epimerase (hydrolysing)
MIIGNSSAGIREAPYYGIPTINIGMRQKNRSLDKDIINVPYDKHAVVNAIHKACSMDKYFSDHHFGDGKSNDRFLKIIKGESFWKIQTQKYFIDN